MSLIIEAQPIFYVLLGILITFAIGGVFFNGLAGTGATYFGLQIQTICVFIYMVYIYIVVNHTDGGLAWAWAGEIFYWVLVLGITFWYLRARKWYSLEV